MERIVPWARRTVTKTAQRVGNAALAPDFHPAPSARIAIELGELDHLVSKTMLKTVAEDATSV